MQIEDQKIETASVSQNDVKTDGTGQKILATKRKTRARFDAQTIEIDEDWTVRRADELNWELLYQGEFKGYYGRLCNALAALPAKMLDKAAQNSLANVRRSVRAIQETIETSLRPLKEDLKL